MKLFSNLFFLLFIVGALFGQESKSSWELKSQKDEIAVYFRESPTSDLKELKITLTAKGQLSSVVALINDVENFPHWVYKCGRTERIKDVSKNEMYYYSTIDFPWPLDDRDFVVHSTLEQDQKTKVVTSRTVGIKDYLPEKEEYVRMPLIDITWILTPTNNNEVEIDYLLKSDSGGNLPAWLVNLAVDHGPVQTMRKLKEWVQLEEYKNKKLAYIID